MLGLSDGERISMIRSTVFDWSARVTDGQTDGRTDGFAIAYSALSMLSRAKNACTYLSLDRIGDFWHDDRPLRCPANIGFWFLILPLFVKIPRKLGFIKLLSSWPGHATASNGMEITSHTGFCIKCANESVWLEAMLFACACMRQCPKWEWKIKKKRYYRRLWWALSQLSQWESKLWQT